ncbi:MAG: glucosamine-6-phosphate deaminase, partial [Pirellulales bacterium]
MHGAARDEPAAYIQRGTVPLKRVVWSNLSMRVIVEVDHSGVSKRAARFVADLVRRRPNCVLGLATGGTPLGMYTELIRMHREEGLDFSRVVTFNLDEYVGLSATHPQSYRYFMQQNFFDHINV